MDVPESIGPLAFGVITGLVAAIASAVSYLVSRHHGNRRGGGSLRLLVLGHAVMGAVCLPLAWLLRPAAWPAVGAWLPWLAGSAGCYLLGQAAVFAALKRVSASRLAPLLGLKIAVLAVIVSVLPGTPLDARQWLAVALAVAAAALLGRGAGVTPAGLGLLAATCSAFACSDLCIVRLIDGLQGGLRGSGAPLGRLHAGALAMALTYAACGGVLAWLTWLPRARPRDGGDWRAAVQYAGAWLGGMVALYACFGTVGVVFGNILQSTRGLIAVLLGAWLAHAGWHDLEEPIDRGTLVRRTLAALLMTVAIGLYAWPSA